MALDLLKLEESGVNYGIESLKIMIYGGNTLGKTPQAMRFPKALLFKGEEGGGAIKGYQVPISSKKDFVDYVKMLTNDKTLAAMKEKYQTIVLDTATDIVDLYKAAVAADYQKSDVSQVKPTKAEPDLPNGYALYRDSFKRDINLLCSKGYTVIFIMHEELAEIKETGVGTDKNGNLKVMATGTAQFKYMPKGSSNEKDSARFLRDLCDFRFYIKGNGIDEDGNVILSTAYCHETEEFYAGSRFDIQNVVNPFTAENLIEAMTEAQKRSAEKYGANLVTFELKDDNYTKADYIRDITPIATALVQGGYGEEYQKIVVGQLKTTARISEAKETQLRELDSIYTQAEELARAYHLEY